MLIRVVTNGERRLNTKEFLIAWLTFSIFTGGQAASAGSNLECEEGLRASDSSFVAPAFEKGGIKERIATELFSQKEYIDLLEGSAGCGGGGSGDIKKAALVAGIWSDLGNIREEKRRYLGNDAVYDGVGDRLLGLRVKYDVTVFYPSAKQTATVKLFGDGSGAITEIVSAILNAHLGTPTTEAETGDPDRTEYLRLRDAIDGVKFSLRNALDCRLARMRTECHAAEKSLDESMERGEFESSSDYKIRRRMFPSNLKRIKEEFIAKGDAAKQDVEASFAPKIHAAKAELTQFLERVRFKKVPVSLSRYDADRERFRGSIPLSDKNWEFDLNINRAEAPAAKRDGLSADIGYIVAASGAEIGTKLVFISVLGPNHRIIYHWGDSAGQPIKNLQADIAAPALKLSFDAKGFQPAELKSGESSELNVTVVNGSGTAIATYLEVSASNLRVPDRIFIGDLGPNEIRKLHFTASAGAVNSRSDETITAKIREARGFDSNGISIRIPVSPAGAPRLMIDSSKFQDATKDGVVSPGEMVIVTFNLKNAGDGVGRNILFGLTSPNSDILFQGERQQEIAALQPGESRDVQFIVMPNMRFNSKFLELQGNGSVSGHETAVTLRIPVASGGSSTIEYSLEPAAKSDELALDGIEARETNQNSYAVILGAEDYKKVAPVSFARNDARTFRDYAVKVLGIPNDPAHMYFLDSGVTLAEMKKVFGRKTGWLAKRSSANSKVVIYYAGHGAPDLESHSAFLIPEDGDPNYPKETGYPMEELEDSMSNLSAKSVVVFLDACFSGADRESRVLLANARPLQIAVSVRHLAAPNVAIFSASTASQISTSDPKEGHGLFTYFLLKNLHQAHGPIHIGDLSDKVLINVKKRAAELDREQEPVLRGNRLLEL